MARLLLRRWRTFDAVLVPEVANVREDAAAPERAGHADADGFPGPLLHDLAVDAILGPHAVLLLGGQRRRVLGPLAVFARLGEDLGERRGRPGRRLERRDGVRRQRRGLEPAG